MAPDISIIVLIAALLALVALVVIVRSLRMPEEHYKKQHQRGELRQLLLKNRMLPPSDKHLETGHESPAEGSSVKSTE